MSLQSGISIQKGHVRLLAVIKDGGQVTPVVMPERAPTSERPRHEDRFAAAGLSEGPPSNGSCALRAKTVEYPDQEDRCTIYPPGLSGIERMERWLTANKYAFVNLETWR